MIIKNNILKLAVDENIPQAFEAYSAFGQVELFNGRKLNNSTLKDFDILIIRSITKVNKELLEGTKVKFVGTATIGVDHIDIDYLNSKKISFASASGCNSQSVTEYIIRAVFYYAAKFDVKLQNLSLGIVGYGNIGKKVYSFFKSLGINVLVNDPPLHEKGEINFSVPLSEIYKCDIITLHVPITKEGKYPTFHLIDPNKLIQDHQLLINTSRGGVIDDNILTECLVKGKNLKAVIDVWENEPALNLNLLNKVLIGTPHIAGYSYDGKLNGTKIIYDKLAEYLGENSNWEPLLPSINNNIINVDKTKNIFEQLNQIYSFIYNIEEDSLKLKKVLHETTEPAKYFDLLRKNYPVRRELSNYIIQYY